MGFAVTMRTLGDYLPQPPAKILDIGGGPGRYAITQRGYEVTLFDLSQGCLDLAKAKEAGVELAGYEHNYFAYYPFSGVI
jgi:2-polyprenyl-3-methyl-5-hydroxy-6-metoxy-1,4-benzoquinol methylase